MKGASNVFKSRYNREESFKPIIDSSLIRINANKKIFRMNYKVIEKWKCVPKRVKIS